MKAQDSAPTASGASRDSVSFPLAINRGGTVVRIYRIPSTVRDTEHQAFTVVWSPTGARK